MNPTIQQPFFRLLLAATLFMSGCDSDDNSTTTDATLADQITIQWAPCEANNQLECASLEVPMAHANPDGEKIAIALNRLPSNSPTKRGSLLFNPGGPGGSGIEMLFSFVEEDIVPEAVRDAYDLVGFDPRGVSASTPVDCNEFFNEDTTDYPLDFAELQSFEADNIRFAEQCVEKYGSYLQHLGSAEVVDDIEQIRKALGESQLDFVGYSYGTRLAALYAQNYPTTTGRIILDASLPPVHGAIELFEGQLIPHENNLQLFTEQCQTHSECDPVTYKQQIIDHTNGLIANQNEVEIDLVGTLLQVAIQEPQIASELSVPFYNYMQTGDFSELITIAGLLDEDEDTGFDGATLEQAVICADDANRPTIEEIEALRARFNEKSDLIAELQLTGAAICIGWPEALRPLDPIASDTAPEVLVISGPTDTQTPASWGVSMAQAIGARYLLSEHPGHTVVFNTSNPCADQVAINYLVDGVLPDQTVCPAPE